MRIALLERAAFRLAPRLSTADLLRPSGSTRTGCCWLAVGGQSAPGGSGAGRAARRALVVIADLLLLPGASALV
jgi:hypothetical protein